MLINRKNLKFCYLLKFIAFKMASQLWSNSTSHSEVYNEIVW